MPNHIKNKIEIIGDINQMDALIKKFGTEIPAAVNTANDESVICNLKGEEYGFCWLDLKTGRAHNRKGLDQIGLPDEYEIEVNQGFIAFPDFAKVIPPPKDDPAYNDLPSQREAEKSPNWWYNWNTANWGSKWGGYSYKREAINIFIFETAWSSVPPIIEAMSKAFPELTIKYSWSDEDSGHNCGRALYYNGLMTEDIPEGGSVEAYEIYFEHRPGSKDDYELVDGEYRYKEEAED